MQKKQQSVSRVKTAEGESWLESERISHLNKRHKSKKGVIFVMELHNNNKNNNTKNKKKIKYLKFVQYVKKK